MFNIALYQPDIPQNTAAIIRLCACFGATLEIIEPCGFHLEDKRIKRIAMDYLKKSKIIRYKTYEEHFSRYVKISEIVEKDYNLSANTYIETKDLSEVIDIKELNTSIAQVVKKIDSLRTSIDEIVADLEGEADE